MHLRQIGNFDNMLIEKKYKDKRDGTRILFLSLKAKTIGSLTLEHDMVILGVKGDAEIWYNQKDADGNANFIDYKFD